MFLDFKKWVKSIQTAGYNGARTVIAYAYLFSVWKIAVSIMWQISQSSVNLGQTMIYFLSKFVPELNHETAVK